jgi:glycine/D-amino acid oxidase-like deaminating enzyme
VTNLDVLVFGGGIAGLWTLDRLRRDGWRAALVEKTALGAGQTIASQGIIHGGGKYALRGVSDFEAVKVIREMPERWLREKPGLARTALLSPRCHLWLPRDAGLVQRGLMAVVEKAGLLSTKPIPVEESGWPDVLRGSASAVWAMAEPVFRARALLDALAAPHREVIFPTPDGLSPRFTVLAAGEGNAELLACRGHDPAIMQRRPLCMVVLRGRLPPLFGHCVVGGKTGLTVTSVDDTWQIGGEIAEWGATQSDEAVRSRAAAELRRYLPSLPLDGLRLATYRAVRAEAATKDARRPSGTHVRHVAPGLVVAWPTKLALAPVLADEVLDEVRVELTSPATYDVALPTPASAPPVAPVPWENAEWVHVR